MELVTERVLCDSTTKKGQPCPNAPVRGQTKCAGHLGLGNTYTQKATEASALARKKRKLDRINKREASYLDVLSAEFQKRREELAAARIQASVDDWRALSDVEQRLFGKPKETISVDTSGEIDLGGMNDLELQELKRRLETEQRKNAIPQSQTG